MHSVTKHLSKTSFKDLEASTSLSSLCMYVCMCVCMYVYMYFSMLVCGFHTFVCAFSKRHTCLCVCVCGILHNFFISVCVRELPVFMYAFAICRAILSLLTSVTFLVTGLGLLLLLFLNETLL